MAHHFSSPFDCCGMVAGQAFSQPVQEGSRTLGSRVYPTYRDPKKSDWEKTFDQMYDLQQDDSRNCAIIVLSDDQREVKKVAEEKGFKVIQEFYNPNSGNNCYIMTRLLWASKDDCPSYSDGSDS